MWNRKIKDMQKNLLIISIALTILGCGVKKTAIIEAKPDVPKDVELTYDEPRDSTSILDINISERNNMQDIGDPYTILNAEIIGDVLWLKVSYGGGCKEHFFEMLFNNAYTEGMIPGIYLTLKHNGNEDHCRAIVEQNVRINLKPIKYGGVPNMNIHLKGWEKPLTYNYEK